MLHAVGHPDPGGSVGGKHPCRAHKRARCAIELGAEERAWELRGAGKRISKQPADLQDALCMREGEIMMMMCVCVCVWRGCI